MELRKQFEKETGESAIYQTIDGHFYSPVYVEWLEERANVWISVEDELPPLATDVFVLVDGVVYKAFYNSDDGCFWNDEGFSFYRDVEKWTIIKQQ